MAEQTSTAEVPGRAMALRCPEQRDDVSSPQLLCLGMPNRNLLTHRKSMMCKAFPKLSN